MVTMTLIERRLKGKRIGVNSGREKRKTKKGKVSLKEIEKERGENRNSENKEEEDKKVRRKTKIV